jgi:hypothetical protein
MRPFRLSSYISAPFYQVELSKGVRVHCMPCFAWSHLLARQHCHCHGHLPSRTYHFRSRHCHSASSLAPPWPSTLRATCRRSTYSSASWIGAAQRRSHSRLTTQTRLTSRRARARATTDMSGPTGACREPGARLSTATRSTWVSGNEQHTKHLTANNGSSSRTDNKSASSGST